MEIPRSLLDSLTDELNALSGAGRQMVENALSRLVPMFAGEDGLVPPENVAGLRAAACEVMETVCGQMSDMAAARSAEFYDEVRAASVGKKLGARAVSGRDSAATDGAVRAMMQSVVSTGSADRLVRELCDRVDYEVKRAAGESVERNARRDPLKPRWARVPSGAETCSFCLMLASRGFVYRSEKSAAGKYHGHPGCDCRIVPGFDGMDVEGYDTGELYRRYLDDVETGMLKPKGSGGRSGRKKWTSAQFEGYGDFAKYVNEAESIEDLQRRCEVAAAEWGKTTLKKDRWSELRRSVMVKRAHLDDRGFGAIYEKPRASLEPHEKKGVDWLVKNGIRPTVKQEDPTAPANIDFEIDGQPWEMKNVTNADSSVSNQLARAKKKWWKLGQPGEAKIVITMDGCTDSLEDVAEALRSKSGYKEAIVVSDEGLRRIQK